MSNSSAANKQNASKTTGISLTKEKKLLSEIKKLKYLLDNIPSPTHTVDKNFNITYLNPKAAELINMSQEECIGKKCYELFKTAHCRTAKCIVHRAIKENKECTDENVIDPQGINQPIQYTGLPLKDEQEKIIGAIEQITDITNLKNVINDLSLQKKYLDMIPAPVHIIDKNFTVQYLNKIASEILYKTKEECIGKKCYELLKTPQCQTSECRMKQAFMTGKPTIGQNTIDPANANLPIQYSCVPIKNSNGEVIGGLEHATIITELKNAMNEISLQNWKQTGLSLLNEKMRGDQDVKVLSNNIISFLVKYLKAVIGTFYTLNKVTSMLKLTGCYAYTKPEAGNDEINIGEGLVGQAAEEKEIIAITEIPKGYLKVKSSIGDVSSGSILIVPYMFEGELMGVFEIASLARFTKQEIDFIKSAVESIGIAVNSAIQRVKMKELLEETLSQSEELQTQQEELKAANEELEEKNQVLEEAEEKLKAQQEELEASYEELEEKTNELEAKKTEFERSKK